MPVYGQNSIVIACKSDNRVLNFDAAWTSDKTKQSQLVTFTFTAAQKFLSRNAVGSLLSTFPRGRRVFVDAIRVSTPNLSGVVLSNTSIATAGVGASFLYVRPANGVDPDLTANNIVINITGLNEWIPVSRVSPVTGLSGANIYFEPQDLKIDLDLRNAETTVFDGLTIYAFLEMKVNSAASMQT